MANHRRIAIARVSFPKLHCMLGFCARFLPTVPSWCVGAPLGIVLSQFCHRYRKCVRHRKVGFSLLALFTFLPSVPRCGVAELCTLFAEHVSGPWKPTTRWNTKVAPTTHPQGPNLQEIVASKRNQEDNDRSNSSSPVQEATEDRDDVKD